MYVSHAPNAFFPFPRSEGMVYAEDVPELQGRVNGLGFFSELISGITNLIGGGQAASAAKATAKATQRGYEAEARAIEAAARESSRAKIEVARLSAESDERSAMFAFLAGREGAQMETEKAREQYRAMLRAMEQQRRAQDEMNTAQLVASTQEGAFSLARTGIVEAGSTSRAFPKWGTIAVIAIVGFGVTGMILSGRKGSGKARGSFREERSVRRRAGRGGGAAAPAMPPIPKGGPLAVAEKKP